MPGGRLYSVSRYQSSPPCRNRHVMDIYAPNRAARLRYPNVNTPSFIHIRFLKFVSHLALDARPWQATAPIPNISHQIPRGEMPSPLILHGPSIAYGDILRGPNADRLTATQSRRTARNTRRQRPPALVHFYAWPIAGVALLHRGNRAAWAGMFVDRMRFLCAQARQRSGNLHIRKEYRHFRISTASDGANAPPPLSLRRPPLSQDSPDFRSNF